MEKNKKIKQANHLQNLWFVLGLFLSSISVLVIFCSAYIFIQYIIKPNYPPTIFGVTPQIIMTNEMSGNNDGHIESGDLVLIKEVPLETIKIQNVVAYIENGCIFVSRVTGINNNETLELTVRADNSNQEYLISESQILGTITQKVNNIGNFMQFTQSVVGIIIFVGVPCLILIAVLILEIINKKKKTESAKEYLDLEDSIANNTNKNNISEDNYFEVDCFDESYFNDEYVIKENPNLNKLKQNISNLNSLNKTSENQKSANKSNTNQVNLTENNVNKSNINQTSLIKPKLDEISLYKNNLNKSSIKPNKPNQSIGNQEMLNQNNLSRSDINANKLILNNLKLTSLKQSNLKRNNLNGDNKNQVNKNQTELNKSNTKKTSLNENILNENNLQNNNNFKILPPKPPNVKVVKNNNKTDNNN